MAEQPRNQKQATEKYQGNLAYFRRGHYSRRLKMLCFVVAVLGSLGAVFAFRFWGNGEFFSTGPISQNHERFANNCEVCHEGVTPDLSRALKLDQAVTNLREGHIPSVDFEALKNAAGGAMTSMRALDSAELKAAAARNLSPEKLSELTQVVIRKSSLVGMDRACLKCHEPYKLHQPQSEAITLRGVHPELPLVHADRCSTCHREHVGHERMAHPGSETCATCHADSQELKRTRNIIKIASPNPPVQPENRDVGDGLIRFLMPQDPAATPAIIKSYADGHPAFQYEGKGARDPAAIKYGHRRHEQDDIPLVNGHKLDCTDCHQPGSGGVFYQPVKYEQHCAKCHSLHLIPEITEIKIPHGDPERVRAYLRTLSAQYATYFLKEKGVTDRAELGRLVTEQFNKLRDRGMTGDHAGDELERRVFFTGDPPRVNDRISPKSNSAQFFPGCQMCHTLTGGDTTTVPTFTKVNMADRWVHHGPFTHLPHRHMSCNDCHGAAHKSDLTTDILMPSQKLCAECHRPLQKDKAMDVAAGGVAPMQGTPEMAAKQRREGGVKWECQSCHSFHADPRALQFLEAKGPSPTAAN